MQQVFEFSAMVQHRERAARRIANVAPVLAELGQILLDRLDDVSRKFSVALDFGGRGAIAPALRARGMAVTSADFSGRMAALSGGSKRVLQSEDFGLGEQQYDLIAASFALHFINDLPGALIQLRRALQPGGLFLASMPVLGTLQELREALLEAEDALTGGVSPRVSPFPDLSDCAALLQRAGFAVPIADVEDIAFQYADPFALLRELRDAGETNAIAGRSRKIPPRTLFPAALARLPVQDGRCKISLRMAVLTGWAP